MTEYQASNTHKAISLLRKEWKSLTSWKTNLGLGDWWN